ncbi:MULTISPECIES: methyltransferase domain-containing protein [Maribacter]|uniref:Methyltransferase domain-containing protein n=1 Tax=Maribacter flavus TaxID=1658664 RepID=A0ABU7IIC3_9FLAO|nr:MULTISPECIES: methyltransferase domain-containing protein [Maribacter]MDC6405618.1 methyltransferase domain-containing protein [Maribacter sp. PR66]MEE1972614.1 methyltransferase domain-containing protein [Maribacter flavus]
MMDISTRSTKKERLDDFQGSQKELDFILEDINRVNRLLGGIHITSNAVFRMFREHKQESYTILDVGCSDGDMLRKLALKARKLNIRIHFIGLDLNKDALEIARKKSVDFPEISYLNRDVFTLDSIEVDIVITTLTLHHFSNANIPIFLERFVNMAHIGVIINDLQRSRLAYYLFKAFSVIFIKTETAKNDGLISILRGFKKKELQTFSDQVPNVQHKISWKWAFRYRWILKKCA